MTARTVPEDLGRSWRDEAACLDHPAEWFTGPHAPGDTRRAIDVCNTCPVKQPCLAAALDLEVSADLGIWGGTTPTTRRRLRRERAGEDSPRGRPKRVPDQMDQEDTLHCSDSTLELFEDEHGDHVDRSGRIVVFEIHGDPPFMLMIDGKPRARTSTVRDAAGLAARLLLKIAQPCPDALTFPRDAPELTDLRSALDHRRF
jgi:WhiB family transcriptional regulator, redox-sensing transcriptional regulator